MEKKPSLNKRAKRQLKLVGKKSTEQKKSGGSVLMSTKIDFKTWNTALDIGRYCIIENKGVYG